MIVATKTLKWDTGYLSSDSYRVAEYQLQLQRLEGLTLRRTLKEREELLNRSEIRPSCDQPDL
jgi:hypothetical protein